jgi:hypothetical protein
MTRLRKGTAWIAAGWLLCQAFALSVPIAAAVIAETADVCTCPGGTPGAQCPMHHHGLGIATSKPSGPALQNACAQPDATLLSLAGGLGVLPQAVAISVDSHQTTVASFASIPVLRPAIPDAPPPRA